MKRALIFCAAAGVVLASSLSLKFFLLRTDEFASLDITDRYGTLLRRQLSDQAGTTVWAGLDHISPHLISATVAAEDHRFYRHPGVDPLALGRAVWQNLQGGRVISGGSTLTQQLVRVARNNPRTWFHKSSEALQALLLELTTSKKTILTHYLNRAPYGNQCFGVGAAARLYFNKPPAHLSLAESAFLAGLPQSPTRYNPYTQFKRAQARELAILARLWERRLISRDDYRSAREQRVVLAPRESFFLAPHFTDYVLSQRPKGDRIRTLRTTLDWPLQRDLEALVRTSVKRMSREYVTNAAVVVMDNRTREVRAMIGSANYFDDERAGQVNGATAPRQPGSTWKPFTYALALEQGVPASQIIPDLPLHAATQHGDFAPRNYDEEFHGPVRLRTALACSYNIPPVRLMEQIGVDVLLNRLQRLGFSFLTKPAQHYGLGLTLGGAEASLFQLVQAYAALGNAGQFQPARLFLADSPASMDENDGDLVFSPSVTYLLTDILSDNAARAGAFGSDSALVFPFPCAVKTGTSKNYRDSLTVGYTTDYTVGVWLGNFDGRPMKKVAGSTGAGRVFRDIMFRLHQARHPAPFEPPQELFTASVCPRSGLIPTSWCRGSVKEIFIPGTAPAQECSVHRPIRVDIRNGLLATEECSDAEARTEVFEVHPPMYRVWMAERNMPEPPTKASPLCRKEPVVSAAASSTLEPAPADAVDLSAFDISFPDHGDVFVIDPILRREYQTLLLKPRVGQGIEFVEWLIDGKVFQRVKSPFTTRWTLSPGRHEFKIRTAVSGRLLESPPVSILVQ